MLENVNLVTLPDNLWRRYQELNLILGHGAKSGELPELKDSAFRLRLTESQLSKELEELASLGLINHDAGRYSLPNFIEEQDAESPAERKAKQRERERSTSPCHDSVTICDTDREIEKKDIIKQSREEDSPAAAIFVNEEAEPDEAFWNRMKDLRPDLSIPRQIDAMKAYLHKKGDSRGITRRFAENWIRTESAPLKEPSKAKIKSKPSPQIDEEAALAWLRKEYEGTAIDGIPVDQYCKPTKEWHSTPMEAYLKYLGEQDAD